MLLLFTHGFRLCGYWLPDSFYFHILCNFPFMLLALYLLCLCLLLSYVSILSCVLSCPLHVLCLYVLSRPAHLVSSYLVLCPPSSMSLLLYLQLM
jgi:hypothetical protein